MPEHGMETVQKLPKEKVRKMKDAITRAAAQKYINSSGFKKLEAAQLEARAKVGRYIEQEGEHHIARSQLAYTFSELEGFKKVCEDKLTLARDSKDTEGEEKWTKMSLIVLEQMNRAAAQLNMTRRKVDPDNSPSAFVVPTMPARTVITNNTQIVVNPAKKE